MELIIRDIELSDVKQLKNFKCENTSMEVFLAEEAYYYHVCGEGIITGKLRARTQKQANKKLKWFLD